MARLAVGSAAPPPLAISAFIGGDSLEGRVRRLLEPARHRAARCAACRSLGVLPAAVVAAIWGLPAMYQAAEFLVRLGR